MTTFKAEILNSNVQVMYHWNQGKYGHADIIETCLHRQILRGGKFVQIFMHLSILQNVVMIETNIALKPFFVIM